MAMGGVRFFFMGESWVYYGVSHGFAMVYYGFSYGLIMVVHMVYTWFIIIWFNGF